MSESATRRVRVVVADDHALVRAGFRSILTGEHDIDVIGEATDGREAVAIATRDAPDVVLMDIRMPSLDGIEATRLITANPQLNSTKVIVLTTFDLDEYVFGALRAGASGFLLKGVDPTQLIDAVRTVASGEALLEPGATRRLIEAYVARDDQERSAAAPAIALPESLTTREIEILTLVAGGLNNAEIAARLVISPLTTKSHVSRILAKVDARDRTQLVVLAYESGLIAPGQSSELPLEH
jgi:DNA-binding NarL/FixJ family response regulator